MREADNNSLSILLSVVGAYVVRTSSLNDKHSWGVCIYWTGLLDWTTGLTFELTFERFSFQLL